MGGNRFLNLAFLLGCFLAVSASQASELVGFSLNRKVSGGHIFSVVQHLDQSPGWGVAFYPDQSLQLFRETKPALTDEFAQFLIGYKSFKSKILIAQVSQKDSQTPDQYNQIQPFQREIKGKRYSFAYRGTLTNYQQHLPLHRFKPLGKSISEYLFCYLLGAIEDKGIQSWTKADFAWLEKTIRAANAYGTIDLLLADGEHLFLYHDMNPQCNQLHLLTREPPYGTVHFPALNKDIDLRTIYSSSTSGFIVATLPLTTEQWKSIGKGQLLVLKNGTKAWEGTTSIHTNNLSQGSRDLSLTLFPTSHQGFGAIRIGYTLPVETMVQLQLFDAQGTLVHTVHNEVIPAGKYSVLCKGMDKNSKPFTNGLYFLRLATPQGNIYKSLLLVR